MKNYLKAKIGRCYEERGFGLLDVLAGLAIASIICGTAISNLRSINDTSDAVADGIVSVFRDARAKAFATTLAYTVDVNSRTIRARYSALCSTVTKTSDPNVQFKLPLSASLSNSAWSVCFDSRGFATAAISASVNDSTGRTTSFEVVLGGGARKL